MEDEIKALIEAGADGQTIADYMNAKHAMQSGAVAERGPHPIIDRRQAAGLVAADAMTAGTWPYIGAGIQALTGHKADVPYEDRRRDIQRQTELARQQHPAMSEAQASYPLKRAGASLCPGGNGTTPSRFCCASYG